MSASSSRVKRFSMFVGIIAAAKRISKMIVKVAMSDSLIATCFVSILHFLEQKLPRQGRSFVTGQVDSSIVSRFLEMQNVCQFSAKEVILLEADRLSICTTFSRGWKCGSKMTLVTDTLPSDVQEP